MGTHHKCLVLVLVLVQYQQVGDREFEDEVFRPTQTPNPTSKPIYLPRWSLHRNIETSPHRLLSSPHQVVAHLSCTLQFSRPTGHCIFIRAISKSQLFPALRSVFLLNAHISKDFFPLRNSTTILSALGPPSKFTDNTIPPS